jgi:release factor glutamine methyltransferase
MTIQEGEKDLVQRLLPIYGEREAAAISDRIMEYLLQRKKIDRILNKSILLTRDQSSRLEQFKKELSAHKPLQYVIHEAWFMGMKLYVDENVLIPRPETEELVGWVSEDLNTSKSKRIRILDIGSGSGCIAIALKKKFPQVNVISCDISSAALGVARRNADAQQAPIDFIELDFLDQGDRDRLPIVDIIVSNPPYIRLSEYDSLEKNVAQFEPHQALFVPDDHPLIFYEAIAQFAKNKLEAGGEIFAEINETKAGELKELFYRFGFVNVEIRKDLQGTDRLIKAIGSS